MRPKEVRRKSTSHRNWAGSHKINTSARIPSGRNQPKSQLLLCQGASTAGGHAQIELAGNRDPPAPDLTPLHAGTQAHLIPEDAQGGYKLVHLLRRMQWAWRQPDALG